MHAFSKVKLLHQFIVVVLNNVHAFSKVKLVHLVSGNKLRAYAFSKVKLVYQFLVINYEHAFSGVKRVYYRVVV